MDRKVELGIGVEGLDSTISSPIGRGSERFNRANAAKLALFVGSIMAVTVFATTFSAHTFLLGQPAQDFFSNKPMLPDSHSVFVMSETAIVGLAVGMVSGFGIASRFNLFKRRS